MPEEVAVILNIRALPPSPNVLKRKYRDPHVYKKLRDEWARMLLFGARSADTAIQWRRTVKGGVKVRLDARLYHEREYDPDNLIGSLKPVLDALVDIGFLVDDDRKHLELGDIEQIRSNEMTTVLYLSVVDEKTEAA